MGITRKWFLLLCVAAATATGLVYASQPDPPGPPPALVRFGVVQQQQLQSRWDGVGRLQEVHRAVVASEQQGRVIEVPVEQGDRLTADHTVLARIDDIWARIALGFAHAQLAQTQAGVDEALAGLEQATRDRRYLEELHHTGSAKPKEAADAKTLEDAQRARLERARADVQAAEAEVQRVQEQLDRLTVLAPFDGVVVRKMTEVGQWVNPGDAVAEIISRGQIDAVVDVPEQYINDVQLSQTIQVMVEALSLEVMGQVAAITPQASTAARTFPVKVRVDDRGGQLKTGMSVVAQVPTGQRVQVLTVPRDAVHRSAMGVVVWSQQNGLATPVPVRVLFGHEDRYAVVAVSQGPGQPTLTPEMPVVIEGAERLFPGQPLQDAEGPKAGSPQEEEVSTDAGDHEPNG